MRFLIQTLGSAGDVHPFVAIGRALRARGHEVLVWANASFRDVVVGAGLAFREAGSAEALRAVEADPDLWHPRRGLRLVFEAGVVPSLEPVLEALRAEVRPAGDVLVAGTLGLAARVLRDVVDVPLATVHLAPCAFRSNIRAPRYAGLPLPDAAPRALKRFGWWLSDRVLDRIVGPPINALRARHALPPVRRIFHAWCHAPDLVLALFPAWFAPPQPDWPRQVVCTGFPLFDEGEQRAVDPDLEAWLAGGDAPLVFTAGSANVHGRAYYARAVEIAGRLGRRAVIVTRERGLLPVRLPPGVRHEAYVPFGRLLPRAAALVSHAGIGTLAQGLRAGIPQLARPLAFDQVDNASRLADLGVGAALRPHRFTTRRAAAALARLLDSADVARCAARAAERIAREDPVAATCDALEDLGRRAAGPRADGGRGNRGRAAGDP